MIYFYQILIDYIFVLLFMTTVSLSPKFQIVIPKEVRETLSLEAGTKIDLIPYADRIELIPVRPLKTMIGSLKGIHTRVIREKDRL